MMGLREPKIWPSNLTDTSAVHMNKTKNAEKGMHYEKPTVCCFELADVEPDSHSG